ncbi:MAG: ABC transporter permease [Ruminococcaceae bacterium]|nr:ABC transporter permease [Oscillospiraceae bacterium]
MKNISAIFFRQLKDTIKNKSVLIQFLMFPMMTLIMENTIKLDNMPPNFFAELYAVMYVGMAPLTAVSSIIAEEKEKNTLRVLLMANVKPHEYMLGVGSYVWLLCMAGALVIGLCADYSALAMVGYMLVMAVGFVISILAGATVGLLSPGQMAATSISVPMMTVFSFLPMIAMFNSTIEKIAKFCYTYQIKLFLALPDGDIMSMSGIIVLACSFAVAVTAFIISYKRNGLE